MSKVDELYERACVKLDAMPDPNDENMAENESEQDTVPPEKGQLVYIPVDHIDPHPDNPRKDLGDLTELADSIKANGILQNLTVVPWFSAITQQPADDGKMDDYYRALIGHRRLAAAKQAGLKEVPCVVVELTRQEQLQTMLQENMQRSDLTIYEQAQGFQMMLDLGDTVESLAKKSGFSQSTIRRRVKLLELDEDRFKESVERGATLADYMELDKLESQESKNRVLKSIGTPNFNNELKRAVDEEKRIRRQAAWREVLSAFATEVKERWDYQVVRSWTDHLDAREYIVPEDADTVKYYFTVESWGYVYLLKEKKTVTDAERAEQAAAEQEKAEREKARKTQLREAGTRAYELRAAFADNVSVPVIKQHMAEILAYWVHLSASGYDRLTKDDIIDAFELETVADENEGDVTVYAECLQKVSRSPERALWRMVCLTINDDSSNTYSDWSGEYCKNWRLTVLYELLGVLGYEMSDEERQLQDGTHPLFKKEG